jgi:hypothetical protein
MTPDPTPTAPALPLAERKTFYRVAGDPPTCEAVEFRPGVIDHPDQQPPYWWPITEGHNAMTCDFVAKAGYAETPAEAWELAQVQAAEAYYAAENARLKARERWTAICKAAAELEEPNRCRAAMVKGRCELDEGHDGWHRTRDGEYVWGISRAAAESTTIRGTGPCEGDL